MIILGIETSCDETSVAVVENGQLVLSNSIRSSIDLHREFGGVVPEIAAREHVRIMIPVVKQALAESKKMWSDIDAIAVTVKPGLIGSLLIGINTARVLAEIYNKKLIEVDHIHGHIYSNWLTSDISKLRFPKFPLVVLTVSGGHNDIILMKDYNNFELLGETIDDAAGEAFDKVAKMLGLPYPGGPEISKISVHGDCTKYKFPRSWLQKDKFDFSFSGLKTSVLYKIRDLKKLSQQDISDLAASFQEAVCDVLSKKLLNVAQKYQVHELHLAGGVSANTRLRQVIQLKIDESSLKLIFRYPENIRFCTDNAAMIAAAGYYKLL